MRNCKADGATQANRNLHKKTLWLPDRAPTNPDEMNLAPTMNRQPTDRGERPGMMRMLQTTELPRRRGPPDQQWLKNKIVPIVLDIRDHARTFLPTVEMSIVPGGGCNTPNSLKTNALSATFVIHGHAQKFHPACRNRVIAQNVCHNKPLKTDNGTPT